MTTYLYHFSKDNQPIIGLFTSPTAEEKNNDSPHSFSHNTLHRIGLINLDITAKDLNQVKDEEKRYANRIYSLLCEIE